MIELRFTLSVEEDSKIKCKLEDGVVPNTVTNDDEMFHARNIKNSFTQIVDLYLKYISEEGSIVKKDIPPDRSNN